MNLEDLAIKYGTDKKCQPGGNGGHGYTTYYEKYFEPIRYGYLNVMEMGVREGWSMRMWEEYFPNSNIFGIDNNVENLCPNSFNSSKILFTLCSQTDKETLTKLSDACGGFDVVIDDASHISSLTIESFNILFPILKVGGIYVIEDMHVCSHPIYNPDNFSTHQFIDSIRHRDGIRIEEFLGRKICFIKKIK